MRPVRMLVLDDEPMVRRIWQRFAERHADLELTVVGTPDEVWAALNQQSFDLIACDWQLEVGTCADLVRALRARGERVVVVSADVPWVTSVLGTTVPIYAKGTGILAELLATLRPLRRSTIPASSSIPPPPV